MEDFDFKINDVIVLDHYPIDVDSENYLGIIVRGRIGPFVRVQLYESGPVLPVASHVFYPEELTKIGEL